MKYIYKLFNFLSLLDRDGNRVSITNLVMYAITIKIMCSPFDWATATTLFIAVMNYTHRRYQSSKDSKVKETIAPQVIDVDKLKSEILELSKSKVSPDDLLLITEQIKDLKNKQSQLSVGMGLKGSR